MNNTETFIFIGRSGCGKGTQAKLLEEYLKSKDSKEIVHLETGVLFREFIKGETATQNISREIYDKGGLQPEFLTVNLWSNFFIKNINKDQHIIIDGTPRKKHEAQVLDSAMKFYGRNKPHVIYINVSRNWSKERLMARHRIDDNADDIEERLNWFDTDVVPAINWYKDNEGYFLHEINGEQTIEEVNKEMMEKISGKK